MTVLGQKKLDRRHADHLAAILRPIVRDQFGGNQTAFAKKVGVSQSQMNVILSSGGDRSVGINVLIRIRDYLGTMTIDEMLGLPPLRGRPSEMTALELVVERALDRRFPKDLPAEPPAHRLLPPAPKKRGGID